MLFDNAVQTIFYDFPRTNVNSEKFNFGLRLLFEIEGIVPCPISFCHIVVVVVSVTSL